MRNCTASELADALGEAIALWLVQRGWGVVEQPLPRPGIVGQFKLPLRNRFAAVATLRWTGPATRVDPDFKIGVSEDARVWRIEPDASSLSVTMQGGVCFGQAEQLAEFLDINALPWDLPVPFVWLTEESHPPTEHRIDRLYHHETQTPPPHAARHKEQTA